MSHPFLVSDGGAIGHILLFVPLYEAEHFAGVYNALIDSMADGCRITLLAEPAALDIMAGWPVAKSHKDKLTIVSAGPWKLTAWARDPAVAVPVEEGAALVVSNALDRRDDLAGLKLLADQDGFSLSDADIGFEGGNMLFGQDHVFIGVDTVAALDDPATIAELVPDTCQKIIIGCSKPVAAQMTRPAMAGEEQWQEIFHYHNKIGTHQPVFHIDMFLSLAGQDADGRQIILVGDPAMAAEILGTPLHPHSLADCFDEIADDLVAQDFTVIRNPLPMIYMDDIKERSRTWIYASGNNVLVQQCRDRGNIVWMAEYGHDHWPELAATDAVNRQIWENLGFAVRTIPQGQLLAENLGGLHCLTNVVERG